MTSFWVTQDQILTLQLSRALNLGKAHNRIVMTSNLFPYLKNGENNGSSPLMTEKDD